MKKAELRRFEDSVIASIRDFIVQTKNSLQYKDYFQRNLILREDVFDILEACCTAIYYPLEGEENDGFHISYPVSYQDEPAHFVYLNTAKPVEKLVFAAAHELGHIWKVDQITGINTSDSKYIEDLMNRFAAELLMPVEVFAELYKHILSQSADQQKENPFVNLLSIIAILMNEFCVPFRAVVLRLWEVDQINERLVNLLLYGPDDMGEDSYHDFLEQFLLVCKENDGYGRIGHVTKKKSIPGFAKILQEAESSQKISNTQIEALRQKFELQGVVKSTDTFKDILLDL